MTDREKFLEQGYLLCEGFFDPAEVEAIRQDAKRVFGLQMLRLEILHRLDVPEAEFEEGMYRLFEQDLQTFAWCGKQAQHLISLHRLSLDSRILKTLQTLGLGFPNIATRPLMYFNSPRLAKKEVYWRLALHQDWRSIQGSLDGVVVWIPLVEIDRALGALEVLRGSHRHGLFPSTMDDGYGRIDQPVDEATVEAVEVNAGDALIFSTLLAHRSGTNVTDSIRWSCHFRYNNLEEASFIGRGYPHSYIYRPQDELITPDFPSPEDLAAAFGPEPRVGSSGEEP